MASQANSTTAPIVPVNATMAELFAGWEEASAFAKRVEQATQQAHDSAVTATDMIAPCPVWSMGDFLTYGGQQSWVDQRISFIHVEWLEQWFGLNAARAAPENVIRHARDLIAAYEHHKRIWEEMAEGHGYNAGTDAELAAYNRVRDLEDAIIKRPCVSLEELKLKAAVAAPNFHPEGSPGHEWSDACALSLIEDVAAL